MATLQKFKLLATQCGVAPSPTRSPMTSPVVQFPRRKSTLRMLLSRSSGRRWSSRAPPPQPRPEERSRRGTLKDLFVSSPAFQEEEDQGNKGDDVVGVSSNWMTEKCQVWRMKKEVGDSTRPSVPGWIGFRHRAILRRSWRPVLVGIPETDSDDSETTD
ncbi:hypothetical protein LINGRAHAP2_LOCUS29608 [Linum grandiflorum]